MYILRYQLILTCTRQCHRNTFVMETNTAETMRTRRTAREVVHFHFHFHFHFIPGYKRNSEIGALTYFGVIVENNSLLWFDPKFSGLLDNKAKVFVCPSKGVVACHLGKSNNMII